MIRTLLLGACALGALGCSPSFHKGPMPGEPRDALYADVEGTRVRYTDRGEGPAVVMIHGFASSLETWLGVEPVVARTHRVITLDLKGFGWTDRPEGDYSPLAQARIVSGLLEARGVSEAAVVAHSWGSSVALALALSQPERVTRLALYDAWIYEEQLPSFFLLSRADGVGEALFGLFYKERPDDKMSHAFFDQRFVTQKLIDEVDRALERPGTVAAALAAVRGQRFAAVQSRYRTIQKPALLLWGREDEVTTLPYGEQLARDLPQSKLVVYPRCGHFPMIEALAASNADLTSFLDAPPAAPATPPAARPATRPATPDVEQRAREPAPSSDDQRARDPASPPETR